MSSAVQSGERRLARPGEKSWRGWQGPQASRFRAGDGSELVRVYVWDRGLRVVHWSIAFSIVLLSLTGFYIGWPAITVTGATTDFLTMGNVKALHYYAAIVFTLSVLARMVWFFTGNRYARLPQFIPFAYERRRDLGRMFRFYTFLRKWPPTVVGHNPLAGAIYVLVYLLCLLMVVTGLGLYSASATVGSPLASFGFLLAPFGGLQAARWVHHVGMWLLLGFAAHHVCSAVLVSLVERTGTVESIVSGWKWVAREKLPPDAIIEPEELEHDDD